MLLPFKQLYYYYDLKISGILHVGAHECEEINDYEQFISRDKILWIEAIKDKVLSNKNIYDNLLIEQAIVSDCEKDVIFNVSNNGQSSSYLELGIHKQLYPHINYISSYTEKTKTLETILNNYNTLKFNFINLDIQGTELKALKGMGKYLDFVDYIYTEISSCELYKDCNLVEELDEYLGKFNFRRVETYWTESKTWGDAFYIRYP
jgi:FkbM family methyltransferase